MLNLTTSSSQLPHTGASASSSPSPSTGEEVCGLTEPGGGGGTGAAGTPCHCFPFAPVHVALCWLIESLPTFNNSWLVTLYI